MFFKQNINPDDISVISTFFNRFAISKICSGRIEKGEKVVVWISRLLVPCAIINYIESLIVFETLRIKKINRRTPEL